MTLTALIVNGTRHTLICPSAQTEIGANRTKVLREVRLLQRANKLFCPHCFEKTGKLLPVRLRSCESKRDHFFHQGENKKECSNHSGESEKHQNAKAQVLKSFEALGLGITTKFEHQIRLDGKLIRQPDGLVIYPNGAEIAIEIQVSPIALSELIERTEDVRRHQTTNVQWYLYGGNFSAEIRRWCLNNNVECFHLWFEDSDEAKPKWRQDSGGISTQRSSLTKLDACSKKTAAAKREVAAITKIAIDEKERRKFQVGDRVTGAPGRTSAGWHGVIKSIETLKNGKLYYWVYWKERETHENKLVRKQPMIGMLEDQIRFAEN